MKVIRSWGSLLVCIFLLLFKIFHNCYLASLCIFWPRAPKIALHPVRQKQNQSQFTVAFVTPIFEMGFVKRVASMGPSSMYLQYSNHLISMSICNRFMPFSAVLHRFDPFTFITTLIPATINAPKIWCWAHQIIY